MTLEAISSSKNRLKRLNSRCFIGLSHCLQKFFGGLPPIHKCLEIEEHLQGSDQREALQDKIGALLHAVLSLCNYCQFDAEQTLRKNLNKFQQRLEEVKRIAGEQGLDNL